jgi:uncharacterized protein
MKVVVDTNVFIVNRFKKEGARKRLIDDCIDHRVDALYTEKMRDEAARMLKKYQASKAYRKKVRDFFLSAYLIEEFPLLYVCNDPADNKFVRCAVAGDAQYIITEDKQLRALDGYSGINVRTASEFYQENNMPKVK